MKDSMMSRNLKLRELAMLARGRHATLRTQPAITGSPLFSPKLRWHSSAGESAAPTTVAAAIPNNAEVVDFGERIIETELRLEAEQSYLSYAMSVIVGRALPDARDGLKPVHRRILYAMHELGLAHNKPFRKCARIVGEVLGKFHPHGDTAVYDALVRMAQDFSMREPLVDGHGNFGSLDDDPPAAMRYTECRLQAVASGALLADLEAETVDFIPNFDASVMEPTVLPARVPNLLINGSSGIAVGIATKIPPHNMAEVVAGLKAYIRDPSITSEALMKYIPAPDFPTGGEIIMNEAVHSAYTEGKGGVTVRAKMHIEEGNSKKKGIGIKSVIAVTELPYQTNKAALVEQIAKLVDAGTLTGISDVRDESDRDGMRIAIEIKKGSNPTVVLNQLLKHTTLQTRFSCNMVALVNGLPQTLTLKQFLEEFLVFRCRVIERRTQFELRKAEKRLHLVDGLLAAMADVDKAVAIIREADDAASASINLQSYFSLSKEQSEAVLALTLKRLTSLETSKLQEEQGDLQARILDLQDVLLKKDRLLKVVVDEADEIVAKHGNERRSVLVAEDMSVELKKEDIIPNKPSLIVFSKRGYIKRMSADAFTVQRLRGQGKTVARLKENDALEEVISVNDHDCLLFFTAQGRAYSVRAFDVPEGSRTSVGTAIAQVLGLERNDTVAAMLPVSQFREEESLVMLSAQGQILRTTLTQFSKINSRGLAAMKLKDGDSLRFVAMCKDSDSILITSSSGMALHFVASRLRPLARGCAGNKTMSPGDGSLVGMNVLSSGLAPINGAGFDEELEDEEDSSTELAFENVEHSDASESEPGPWLLLVTRTGLGKRVPVSLFRLQGRVGKGLIAIKVSSNDALAASLVVGDAGVSLQDEDALVSSSNGMLVRVALKAIHVSSRIAKGHRIVKLKDGDEVGTITIVHNKEE